MFRTTFGGCISLGIVLVILGFFLFKIKVLLNYEGSISKMNEFMFKSDADTDKMSFKENGLSLLVTIAKQNRKDFYLDKKYGNFNLFYNEQKILQDQGGEYQWNVTDINLVPCNTSNILLAEQDNEELLKNFELSQYLCPEQDLFVQGLQFSNTFGKVMLSFKACDGEDYCASEEEMEDFYNNAVLDVIIGDRWFDSNNYEQPIQTYYQSFYQPFVKGEFRQLRIFVQNNTAILQDSLWGVGEQVINFPKATSTPDLITHDQGGSFQKDPLSMFRVIIELDRVRKIYERSVYNLNDLMSDIGGFFNSFFFIGSLIYFAFKEPLFYTQIISECYLLSSSHSENLNHQKNCIDDQIEHDSVRNINSDLERACSNIPFLDSFKKYVSSLKALSFSGLHIFKFGMQRVACGRLQKKRSAKDNIHRYFFLEGKKRLLNELDCVSMIQKLRKLDFMFNILLKERFRKYSVLSFQSAISTEFKHCNMLDNQNSLIQNLKTIQENESQLDKELKLLYQDRRGKRIIGMINGECGNVVEGSPEMEENLNQNNNVSMIGTLRIQSKEAEFEYSKQNTSERKNTKFLKRGKTKIEAK